jgi:hypothetical protein
LTPTKERCTFKVMATSLPHSCRLLSSIQNRRNDTNINDRIQRQFVNFHENNSHVYRKLVELARQVKAKGKARYSINSLFERLRWHFDIETEGSTFLLNNNFRSRYVRLISQQEPDLKGFFVTRPLASGKH